ncbi:MAG: rhodanese-like domain-containing protein [Terrimonas sp.]|nr:rhodanese-like domain-containing protein [Terrimonas sp.]
MGLFSFLFGDPVTDALKKGAVIIDVRNAYEYDQGKVPGSINIPVDRISASIERIRDMKKPVIFCCSSGSRSGDAKTKLKAAGISEVYNGGSWQSLLKKVQSL